MWNLFKKWFATEATSFGSAPVNVEAVLGELKNDPKLSNVLFAVFSHGSQTVELRIDPDDRTIEECLETARKLLTEFHEMNEKALSTASNTLLSNYNENWRVYSEKLEDGSYEDVSRPILDRSTFEACIQISAVGIFGSMVEFMYSDKGLFHGHTIVVSSFDGLNFTDTNADIFG